MSADSMVTLVHSGSVAAPPTTPAQATAPPSSPPASESFAGALASFVADANGDHASTLQALRQLGRGDALGQRELLLLQAQTYRYAHRVDVATRVVDLSLIHISEPTRPY